MARLHSRKKGKSGTRRPKSNVAPQWVTMDRAELGDMIVKMVREGAPPTRVALVLRDQYGIANVRAILGMSMLAFLRKEKAAPEYPDDLVALVRKAARIRSHLKASGKDVHNKVKLGHVESKINRLVKYYSSKGAIPKDWRYDPSKSL